MKCLITNRGEIARRILKTVKRKGWMGGIIATAEDRDSLVCVEADFVLEVSSFLNGKEIADTAQKNGVDLIHPGYGFLSENASFVEWIEKNNILFAGPTAENIQKMGSKESAKEIAIACQVPTLNALYSKELLKMPSKKWEEELSQKGIFAPYLIKASGGGGGKGMRVVENISELPAQLERATSEALQSFNDGTVFVERYLQKARHIEAQVFGDGTGHGVFLGERECTLQRRHQKIIEEAPSVAVSQNLREKIAQYALALVAHTKYRSAGTVEFLLDEEDRLYFLEMNTRLQVEHPVTEIVYNVDLVDAMLTLATGQWPTQLWDPQKFFVPIPQGHAIEARILAEDPSQNFLPTPGKIRGYFEPPQGDGVRVDSSTAANLRINPNYDSMISKLICYGANRAAATEKLQQCLRQYEIHGITTNIPFLTALVRHTSFLKNDVHTKWIDAHLEEVNNLAECPEFEQDFITSPEFAAQLISYCQSSQTENACPQIFSQLSFESDKNVFRFQKTAPFQYLCTGKSLPAPEFFSFSFYYYRGENPEFFEVYHRQHRFLCMHPWAKCYDSGSGESGDGKIYAPMAGKVLECFVQEGDSIDKNQTLFVVESMKMQLEIKAPRSGQIQSVLVTQNQILEGKVVMATLH